MRSAVIILKDDQVALIERIRDGHIYYVFPGGTVEEGETVESAATREAFEELGVHVELQALAAVVTFHDQVQFYYHATISAGQFGMGTGEEFSFDRTSVRGSYRPIWLARHEILRYDIRPPALAQALSDGSFTNLLQPLHIHEAGV